MENKGVGIYINKLPTCVYVKYSGLKHSGDRVMTIRRRDYENMPEFKVGPQKLFRLVTKINGTSTGNPFVPIYVTREIKSYQLLLHLMGEYGEIPAKIIDMGNSLQKIDLLMKEPSAVVVDDRIRTVKNLRFYIQSQLDMMTTNKGN